MKKFFSATFFLMTFIIFNGVCIAYDFYIGEYHTGYKAYIMSETIRYNTIYAADATNAACTIRAVKGNSVLYIDYRYWKDYDNVWHYSNSQGYSGYIDSSANISRKALYFILSR